MPLRDKADVLAGHAVKGANGTLLTVPSLFDAQLGSDPWAETLTPLNEDEIRGECGSVHG